jgi:general secretion pathway protein A
MQANVSPQGRLMYTQFFRLSQEPFKLDPDPKFLYLARSHFEAFSCMMAGIKERKGIIVITGEPGVGKTLLIYALLKDLTDKAKTAFIFNPTLGFQNILENILSDLDVRFDERGKNLNSLLALFRKYLKERLAREETVAVVIDEAQSLDIGTLESLLRFSTSDAPSARMLQILLVGHPVLEEKLNSGKLRPYRKKIRRIRPFTRAEGRGYVKYRLKLAGREVSEIFTSEAVNQVWEFSRGIPRVMNLLCERALVIGCTDSHPLIDSKIIREAIKDLDHLRSGGTRRFLGQFPRKTFWSKIARILFLIFSICVFFFSLHLLIPLLFRR